MVFCCFKYRETFERRKCCCCYVPGRFIGLFL